MPTLLALDTATEACSVALLYQGQVFSRYAVIPRLHAQQLLPMVQEVLQEAGASLQEVEALAFGRGPGAFTGVRIVVGVVQGLAFALNKPVLPISTLKVLAQRAAREQGASKVAVAIDARMDEVYWACYERDQEDWQLAVGEAVLPPEQASLPRLAQAEQWFAAGTGWGTYGLRLPQGLAGCDGALLPHAEDLLVLAQVAFERGEALPASAAQPIYLRDQVATPKRTE